MKSFKILARSAENFAFLPNKSKFLALRAIMREYLKILCIPPLSRGTPPKWQPPLSNDKGRDPPYLPILKLANPPFNLGGLIMVPQKLKSTFQIFFINTAGSSGATPIKNISKTLISDFEARKKQCCFPKFCNIFPIF